MVKTVCQESERDAITNLTAELVRLRTVPIPTTI